KPEDVSKTPKAGEFLPKGAFIFHKRNFMKKMELKVSIGVMIEKDKEGNRVAKAVAGSVQALNKNADYFVTIRPGAVQQPQLAAEIKRKILIKSMPEDTALIEQIPIEDFQRLIPSGGGFIFGG
ncbi:MAG: hypothetical protein QXU82_00125, partial [Candidatus Aenigmatarchaeota archaeon]